MAVEDAIFWQWTFSRSEKWTQDQHLFQVNSFDIFIAGLNKRDVVQLQVRNLCVRHSALHCSGVWTFCSSLQSSAVLDPRIGHTMDVLHLSLSYSHSAWLFHGEYCPRLDVIHPGRVWSSSPACTCHCSFHYLFPLVSSWCDHSMLCMLPCFDGV